MTLQMSFTTQIKKEVMGIDKREAINMLKVAALKILETPKLWANLSGQSRLLTNILNEIYASWSNSLNSAPDWYYDLEILKAKICSEFFRYLEQQEKHRGEILSIQYGSEIPGHLQEWADGWQTIIRPRILRLFE